MPPPHPRLYNPAVRLLAFILLLLLAVVALSAQTARAAEPPAAPNWPLWDGQETVEQYAKRAGVEPTKTLDLGNGVKMEMVLVPAGKFVMGTPEPSDPPMPPPVDEEAFRRRILTGQAALGVGGGALLVLLAFVIDRALRTWRRPQFSLAYLVVMTVVAGVGVLGGMHWSESERLLAEAKAEYQMAVAKAEHEHAAALVRFSSSDRSERPAHEVTLTRPFYMGKFQVTQEQYEQVTEHNPSWLKGRDLPVEMVLWDHAQAFCKQVSEKTRLTVRLPTEAEWEHACRAGTRTTYYTGDTEADLDRAGWYYKNSKKTMHPVGQKAPNAWGLYDMHGNVWEWCGDWYEDYEAKRAVDPQGPTQGQFRVLRGGCDSVTPVCCRSAYRDRSLPDERASFGFRVVVEVPKAP